MLPSPSLALAATHASAPAGRTAARASRPYDAEIARRAAEVNADVIAWRRDFHQNPELSNREFRTSKIVAEKLAAMGLEVKTGVAKTGVVALLRGAKPGPVVALRADMDALPVTEEVDLPFASKARGTYNGQEVGVMHAWACELQLEDPPELPQSCSGPVVRRRCSTPVPSGHEGAPVERVRALPFRSPLAQHS